MVQVAPDYWVGGERVYRKVISELLGGAQDSGRVQAMQAEDSRLIALRLQVEKILC